MNRLSSFTNSETMIVAAWLGVIVGIECLVRIVLRRLIAEQKRRASSPDDELVAVHWLRAAIGPLSFLLWFYGAYAVGWLLTRQYGDLGDWLASALSAAKGLGVFCAGTWFFFKAARLIDVHFQRASARTAGRFDDIALPLFGSLLRLLVPGLALFLLLRLWPMGPALLHTFRKIIAVFLIIGVAWLLRRAAALSEQTLIGNRQTRDLTRLEDRAVITRVRMLRKIIVCLITLFAVAAVLMLFEEVRDIGRSLIASAGVAGIIIGFAAQKSIASLFAGLQIALTQPVRIGDQVKVSGEVGFVEEITLTYIVVRIWDLRRLVLPIAYFIENPVENWTRRSTDLLSAFTIRVDYSMPVQPLRDYLTQLVKKANAWDGKVFAVQVTGVDEHSMEIRVLGSASNAGSSFDLQCFLRENAIAFIHQTYPQCLPKAREEGKPISTWSQSEELLPRDFERIIRTQHENKTEPA